MYQVFLVLLLFLHLYPALSLSDDELDKLERILISYKKSLIVEKKELSGNKIHDAYANSADLLISESHSIPCASRTEEQYERCLKGSKSSEENRKCSDEYVSEYSKCYFGTTLQYGSHDASLCNAYCTFNHDQCIVNSDQLQIFVCIGARDTCQSHCPSCNEKQESKRSCSNPEQCIKRYSKCIKRSSSNMQQDICASTDLLCQPACL